MSYDELIANANRLKSILLRNVVNEDTKNFIDDIEVAYNNRMTETVEGLQFLLKSKACKLDVGDKMPDDLLEIRNNHLNDTFSMTIHADLDTISIICAFNNFRQEYSECLEIKYRVNTGTICDINNYRSDII